MYISMKFHKTNLLIAVLIIIICVINYVATSVGVVDIRIIYSSQVPGRYGIYILIKQFYLSIAYLYIIPTFITY